MYIVRAPYVMLKLRDPDTGGESMHGFYAGRPVPANVDAESLKRHLDEGLVETVEAPAAEEQPKKTAKAADKPGN